MRSMRCKTINVYADLNTNEKHNKKRESGLNAHFPVICLTAGDGI